VLETAPPPAPGTDRWCRMTWKPRRPRPRSIARPGGRSGCEILASLPPASSSAAVVGWPAMKLAAVVERVGDIERCADVLAIPSESGHGSRDHARRAPALGAVVRWQTRPSSRKWCRVSAGRGTAVLSHPIARPRPRTCSGLALHGDLTGALLGTFPGGHQMAQFLVSATNWVSFLFARGRPGDVGSAIAASEDIFAAVAEKAERGESSFRLLSRHLRFVRTI
jgi:hypothetical protein